MTYSEILIHEREMYVSRVLSKEKLKESRDKMGYEPPTIKSRQIKLEFN